MANKTELKKLEIRLANIDNRAEALLRNYEESMLELDKERKELLDQAKYLKDNPKVKTSRNKREPKTIGNFIQGKEKIVIIFPDLLEKYPEGRILRTWTNPDYPEELFVKTNELGGVFHKVVGRDSGIPEVKYFCLASDC